MDTIRKEGSDNLSLTGHIAGKRDRGRQPINERTEVGGVAKEEMLLRATRDRRFEEL